jgi:hypothetical protein
VLHHHGGEAVPKRPPVLVVLPIDPRGYALAWRVVSRSQAGALESFVDAMTGVILLEYAPRGEALVAPFPSHLIPRGEFRALAEAFADIATASAADDLRPLENASPAARAYCLAAAAGASRQQMDRIFARLPLSAAVDATFLAARAATLQAARPTETAARPSARSPRRGTCGYQAATWAMSTVQLNLAP